MSARSYGNGVTTMLTLLANPATPEQRAVRVVREDRPESIRFAVDHARATLGDVPLGWLNQSTGEVVAA